MTLELLLENEPVCAGLTCKYGEVQIESQDETKLGKSCAAWLNSHIAYNGLGSLKICVTKDAFYFVGDDFETLWSDRINTLKGVCSLSEWRA